jgi:hypothetical protein
LVKDDPQEDPSGSRQSRSRRKSRTENLSYYTYYNAPFVCNFHLGNIEQIRYLSLSLSPASQTHTHFYSSVE